MAEHVVYFFVLGLTTGINRSNTAVPAVLKQPCMTGGRTGTVRPKQEPTGWTDLSNRSRLVLCDRSQELIGQAFLTRRQFERCSNSRVRPVVGQALSDRSTCRRVGQACPISSWDRLHRTSRDRSDKSVRPVGSRFGRTVSVRPPVEHGCSSTARAAVFDRLMPAVTG
ncbi:hypothetical protein PCASD_26594 [Puccinia coronata f. sp. avenae]|uniref:Uncharacterized protein n=1 Tax=Puccinia coronata f. sp. avenae TaxID=200324 RepID=A0A2N5TN23_9BASI|nr:hypothetical protein PCASD_26594 [Puccinia coronata f. sp. avenae]